MQMKI